MTDISTSAFLTPDISVQKQECFNLDMLHYLINVDDIISHTEREQLKKYNKMRTGNTCNISYVLGKKCKNEFIGRLVATGGIGLQNFKKDIRNALASHYYWDIDIENAQPVLLETICKKYEWQHKSLSYYINNRDNCLTEIQEHLKCERAYAKQRIVSILFGGRNVVDLPKFFKDDFLSEIQIIMNECCNQYKKEYAWSKIHKKENPKGSTLANILQTEERKCLMAMCRYFSSVGRSLDVLIHDGGLMRKLPDEISLQEDILRECEKVILTDTGYKVNLTIKQMKTSFKVPEQTVRFIRGVKESEYLAKKAEIEKTLFFCEETRKVCLETPTGLIQYRSFREADDCLGQLYTFRKVNKEKTMLMS